MNTAVFPNLIFKSNDLPQVTCINCNAPMKLHHIAPVAPRFDLRTYTCNDCLIDETFVIEVV